MKAVLSSILTFVIALILVGCPGSGDRLVGDETTKVISSGDNVCFLIPEPMDYQPIDMGINSRGTASKNKIFVTEPNLSVVNGELCVPPSFYKFPKNGKLISEFILLSRSSHDNTRKFVVGVGIDNGSIFNIPLLSREITRPAGTIDVNE